MNKHLHNIHFILSILGSLRHMELCNKFSTHVKWMTRKIHAVTSYTPQLMYTTSHECFGEFLRLHGGIILYLLFFQKISSPFFHSAIRNEGPMYFDLQAQNPYLIRIPFYLPQFSPALFLIQLNCPMMFHSFQGDYMQCSSQTCSSQLDLQIF